MNNVMDVYCYNVFICKQLSSAINFNLKIKNRLMTRRYVKPDVNWNKTL